jgi:hypothetical protein
LRGQRGFGRDRQAVRALGSGALCRRDNRPFTRAC